MSFAEFLINDADNNKQQDTKPKALQPFWGCCHQLEDTELLKDFNMFFGARHSSTSGLKGRSVGFWGLRGQ